MKRLTLIILSALLTLGLTQCREPEPETGTDTETVTRKVKVSCRIALSGKRSDFTNLLETGKVNWSNGRECVYLAIPGDNPQIIELESWAEGNPSVLEFEGAAAEGLITSGSTYEVWYFGHSHQLETPFYTNHGDRLEGSVATQSGHLSDVGYNHIAKTTVTSTTTEDGDVKLNLVGILTSQISIAMLDLNDVSELYGNAINTGYSLQYNSDSEKYELVVTEEDDARISVENSDGISYVVLLPNEENNVELKCDKDCKTYAYTFHNGVKSNKVYCRTASDGISKIALAWKEAMEINGHEYVDLGLPSGMKWATCNVGAETPEEYGDYFAWGETETKSVFSVNATYGRTKSELQSQGVIDENDNLTSAYDAATANWGCTWRMPTKNELEELANECKWEKMTQNDVVGYKVTGPNGNHIFLPATGYCNGSSFSNVGVNGVCWSSSLGSNNFGAYTLYFFNGDQTLKDYNRYFGHIVRPISE